MVRGDPVSGDVDARPVDDDHGATGWSAYRQLAPSRGARPGLCGRSTSADGWMGAPPRGSDYGHRGDHVVWPGRRGGTCRSRSARWVATACAAIAEHLYAADSYDDVLQRIAEIAVSTVSGCEMASITIRHGGGYRTASTTDPDATSVDEAQYDAQEGPCLDAVDTPFVYAQSFPDARWPAPASAHRIQRSVVALLPPDRNRPLDRRLRNRIVELLRLRCGCVRRRGAGNRTHPGRARVGRCARCMNGARSSNSNTT